jgi:putative drug exporter of the RND superfamily
MYSWCGQFVGRWPLGTVLAWFFVLILVMTTAPHISQVARDGEFDFLPYESASRVAERAFREAFPGMTGRSEAVAPSTPASEATASNGKDGRVQMDPLGSTIVIVLQREDLKEGLTAQDREFVTEYLEPGLRNIQSQTGKSFDPSPLPEIPVPISTSDQIIRGVWTFNDNRIGPLLESQDGHSTLVLVELTTEFRNRENRLVLSRIEDYLSSKKVQAAMPAGLDVALSGSATVGRDMLVAQMESAEQTDLYTKVLVIVLLLAIYRAPLMMLIPLITVGVAVNVTSHLLRILAYFDIVGLFTGLDVYVSVVVYGAGVDFCLFLIARYKEELDLGASFRDATTLAVKHVGAALATSAGTSIVGIAMLTLTEFGKFRQAGVAISFGLFIALICAMTMTPAMMYLFGRWTFWPDVRRERISASEGFMPARSVWSALQEQRWMERGWEWIAELISRKPGWVFVLTILILTPLAIIGAYFKDHLSYGLLSDLRPDVTSRRGADAVKKHFPPGAAGVTTFLIQHEQFGLTDVRRGEKLAKFITEDLMQQSARLGIADVRSQTSPHGVNSTGANRQPGGRAVARNLAHKAYCSLDDRSSLKGQLLRLDIVFQTDPFARDAIPRLDQAEAAIHESLRKYSVPTPVEAVEPEDESTSDQPAELPAEPTIDYSQSADVMALGATASIRDLKRSTDRDQIRINIYVSVAVFLVLMTLLRQPALCAYLILTVIFSYLVTLGAAYLLFRYTTGPEFSGLDWKVPVYLFTLLLALGEDYNVLFMSRVTEEQPKHGAVPGILVALTKTGGIISSCGVIMAGTFASLMTGSLAGMVQLGFALAFGVMIDTFVVRPILVPAYLVLLNNGTFGSLSKLLGAYQPKAIDAAPSVTAESVATVK